jgi:hypothetical protein
VIDPSVNNFGGWHNAPNYPNFGAFAAVKINGSIMAWGSFYTGGTGAPHDRGYNKSWYSRYQRVHLCRQHLNYPTP